MFLDRNPVLDDPELLLRRPLALTKQFRSTGIEALADFTFLHAGREMAAAAHFRVKARAQCNTLGIGQITRNSDVARMVGN